MRDVRVMQNVTISMDEQALRWVRIEAAKAGVSVSRWIGQELESRFSLDAQKTAASERIERFLSTFPGIPLSENGKITIDRDELYDGGRFHRFDHAPLPAGRVGSGEEDGLHGVAEEPAAKKPPGS
jgi:hypothetical protein